MKQAHFITYNDTYNGVYQSQVIDVVTFLNDNFDTTVKLIAFVPLRLWCAEKAKIKAKMPNASIFPILGGLASIKRTSLLLKLVKQKGTAICRGPLAFLIAQQRYQKLIYDGRAAVEAEVTEYNVTGCIALDKLLIEAENTAINKADFYMAVSAKLVEYWEQKLNKKIPKDQYVIIPCTLTSQNTKSLPTSPSDKVKVVYSGGTGPWQSFEKVVKLLDEALAAQPNLEAIFLTKENEILNTLISKYPDRCTRKWVKHEEVYNELTKCDYGILIRAENVTNRVASPVKFAEYLNAGLKVLISPHIGDFSSFAVQHGCGETISYSIPYLNKVNADEKRHLIITCEQYFKKLSPTIEKDFELLLKNIL